VDLTPVGGSACMQKNRVICSHTSFLYFLRVQPGPRADDVISAWEGWKWQNLHDPSRKCQTCLCWYVHSKSWLM